MTGIALGIDVHDDDVRGAFQALGARVDDLQPAFDEIGRTVVDHTLLRFERQRDPDGNSWTPLSPATVLRRARGRGTGAAQILQDSGRLRLSITHVAERNRVSVGTNVVYGAIHQLGGKAGRNLAAEIPARPFLGLDAADREDIPAILARHLAEALS